MKTVKIGRLVLGEGRPAVCVPLTAREKDGLCREAVCIAACPAAELVEWRADWYDGVFDGDAVEEAVACLRERLGEIPLLFTFRSREEGGKAEAAADSYERVILAAARAGVDAVDVELSRGEKTVVRLLGMLHERNIPVILSSHDFERTPSLEEMTARLLEMNRLGADLCKLAVMPRTPYDTLRLLEATWRVREGHDIPCITMAMSARGAVSRIAGETFGSVLTFGTVGAASAPGQLDAVSLRQILEILHRPVK